MIKKFDLYNNYDKESFLPDKDEVDNILVYLNHKYKIKKNKMNFGDDILDLKYIIIDDKPYYLNKSFLTSKGYLINKMFYDLITKLKDKFRISSIRKAIKIFIDSNS